MLTKELFSDNINYMKTCGKCKTEKTLEEFPNKKSTKDGKYPFCKVCKRKEDKITYEKNKQSRLEKAKKYYENNREVILNRVDKVKKAKYKKLWYNKNLPMIKEYHKEYIQYHRDEITKQRAEYRKNNKDKIYSYMKHKKKTDPVFKLSCAIRKRVAEIIRTKGFIKNKSLNEYLGCDGETFQKHIESQFTSDMNWDNYGKVWNIDHIIPLSIAKTNHQVYELNHYKNLRPLYCKDNFSKNNKLTKCWQKFQREKHEDEDRALGLPFDLNVTDFTLQIEDFSPEHRQFISRYEWLGTVGFGVKWVFTARHEGRLAGVVMISEPNMYQFGEREALIQRGAAASWAPKHLNSKLVMFACRWMVRNTEKRYFTAYSDPEAGEIGTIYQACNFDYLGQTFGTGSMYVLPDGRRVNGRYFSRTSSMKKWAKELNMVWSPEWCKPNGFQDASKVPQIIKDYAKKKRDECKKVSSTPKGKYVLLLNYGKLKFKKSWIPLPYPKRKGE